jgi:signal transduction histidine kinase
MAESSVANKQGSELMKVVRGSLESIRNMLRGEAEGDRSPVQQLENLEQLLLDQEAKLNAVDKVLEEFNYSIAHELCAPLRRISGFTKEIKQRFSDAIDPEDKEVLDNILQSSQQMDDLIEALMEVSRLSHVELQVQPLNLTARAREIAEELKQSAPQRQVEFKIQEDLVGKGDLFLITMALRQLLDNAWKFTSTKDAAVIEFGVDNRNGNDVYFVRDNGVGFDIEEVNRLFHPFQRLHLTGDYSGSGIGLTVVKRIIERHGGKVWAEAAIDQGATFYFTL